MSIWETHELEDPPEQQRQRDLWVQHAAGFIIMSDVRDRTLTELDADLSPEARAAAEAAIDSTIYNFMMIADGVIGGIRNEERSVSVRIGVELRDEVNDEVIQHLDLIEGDGACMGYHMWNDGDFGTAPIAKRR